MGIRYDRHAEAAELRAELRALAATLERAAKNESAAALGASTEAVRELLARANSLVDTLSDVDRAKALAAAGRDRLGETIKTEPFIAVGVAALAGFVLGCMRPWR